MSFPVQVYKKVLSKAMKDTMDVFEKNNVTKKLEENNASLKFVQAAIAQLLGGPFKINFSFQFFGLNITFYI